VFKQIKAWIARELNLQPKDQITEAINENSAVVSLKRRNSLIIADMVEDMYTEDGDKIAGHYRLNFHEDTMPPLGYVGYNTLEELFAAMEAYAPLDQWKIWQPE